MKFSAVKFLSLVVLLCSAGCANTNTNTSNKNSEPVSNPTSESSKIEEKNYWFETYTNPVSVVNASGQPYRTEVADPSVVRGDNGYLYSVSTDRRFLRSEDGCNWEVISDSIIDLPSWGKEVTNSYNLWAPDLIKIGDQWIYYYSLSGWGAPVGIGYATADDIEGPYVDQGKLFTGDEMGILNCIDPQPFVDVDGSVYMTVGSFQGLWLIELTEDGCALKDGLQYQKDNKVLIAGKVGGWDGSTYEGGYIMRKDDYYYYFGSAGTCCEGKDSTYRVYVGRSKDIAGPYFDKRNRPLTMSGSGTTCGELVLWAGSGSDRDVVGVGHNSVLVDDAGDWWIYYHGYSKQDTFGTRHLFMDKLVFDDKGFPYVSYMAEDEDTGEMKEVKYLPSFELELEGPRFFDE
jgi:beta-xylosidase